MISPEMRIIRIAPRGDVASPEPENREGSLLAALNGRGDPVFSAGNHRLIALAPTMPHNPEANGHTVYWVDRAEEIGVKPWMDTDWTGVLGDTEFVRETERYLRNTGGDGIGAAHVYCCIGYSDGSGYEDKPVYPRSVQSQPRMHFHIVEPIPRWVPGEYFLTPEETGYAERMTIFSNVAGERAIEHFDRKGLLADFGKHPVDFVQTVGRNNLVDMRRTMFGFSGLGEALCATFELQARLQKDWVSFALDLARERVEFTGVVLKTVMQTCVPGVDLIFPSSEDRRNGKTEDTYAVWAMPLTVLGPINTLTPGGFLVDRDGAS